MKCHFHFDKLLALMELELKENFTKFQDLVLHTMYTNHPVYLPIKGHANVFLNTIKELISADPELFSTATRFLISNLSLPEYKKHSASKIKSAGICPGTALPANRPSVKPSVSKSKNRKIEANPNANSSTPSRKALKTLKSVLGKKQSFNCKIENCSKCNYIRTNVCLTKCTHPNPHPSGWFVHVSRKSSRRFHNTGDSTEFSSQTGFKNPLAYLLEDENSKRKPTTPMDTAPAEPLERTERATKSGVSFRHVGKTSSFTYAEGVETLETITAARDFILRRDSMCSQSEGSLQSSRSAVCYPKVTLTQPKPGDEVWEISKGGKKRRKLPSIVESG